MRYLVTAVKGSNDLLTLELEAPDESGVRAHSDLKGCTVLEIKPLQFGLLRFKRSNKFPVLLFSRELLALLTAGLSLTEVIDLLVEKEHNPANHKLLDSLRTSLYQGKSLSNALSAFPEVFSDFYVATISASEHTGSLPEALDRYVRFQAQADVIKKRVVSASVYPALLLVAGGLVSLFLMFYVVPRFSKVYEDIRGDIPFFSQLLLEWGRFVSAHAAIALGGIAVLIGLATYWLSQPASRVWLMHTFQRIPTIGERVRLYQLSRLYRTLGMLLRGGIPMVTAIDMAKGLLAQELQIKLSNAGREIREGVTISQAMDRNQLSTMVSSRMLKVGERSGQMGEMMERTADFMDEELALWIDWFTKLFEPLLMGFIGVVIGLIVVLMYMPIFELASSVQ
ncbi:MAG: type II secretion system F family protein [Gammaproteobacteria bacterium]|nr:type II secretion system F family protein [Gammaproteobacteria bacterium]MBU1482163.1 type II secretion system F family protein [Gammaproteobacteria bacterium]